jgi:NTP pyrophosphatase (non-canonical NTP hydrolase)
MKEPLTFAQLSRANIGRCNESFRPINDWTPLEWGGALAGETGELCNFLKKIRRGEKIKKKKVAHELADVIAYADLLASALDINLEEAVREKFNLVSKKKKSKYRL